MPPVPVDEDGYKRQTRQQTTANDTDKEVGVSDGTHLLCGVEVGQVYPFHSLWRIAAVLPRGEVFDLHAFVPVHVV